MSLPNSDKQLGLPAYYDLAAVLRHWQNDTLYKTYCHLPGRIEAFYASDQTADVSISIQRQQDGVAVQLPILPKCPVMVLTGGSTGHLTMPIAAGDTCLVAIADRDIALWWETGSASPPETRRAHDLSDAFAIVGFRHKGNPVSSYDSTNIRLRNLGGDINVGQKIGILNESTSLKTVLDNLIDAIKAQVDTHGDSLNAGTIAALNTVKAQVATLLK